jgi:hypothetical protein
MDFFYFPWMGVYDDMSWLCTHRGFPLGKNLKCPVFTQDKFEYIRGCSHITIPTLKLPLLRNIGDALRGFLSTEAHEYSMGGRMTIEDFMTVILT